MTAEFQKAVDYKLIRLKTAFCFLNDNLIVSKDQKKIIKNVYSIVSKESLYKFSSYLTLCKIRN